ncbi:hypothetical protein ACWDZ8_28490 [Streptomyces sp. NPDC003233]
MRRPGDDPPAIAQRGRVPSARPAVTRVGQILADGEDTLGPGAIRRTTAPGGQPHRSGGGTGLAAAPAGRPRRTAGVCAARLAPHLASRDGLVVQHHVDEADPAGARAFAASGESRRLP